VSSPSDDMVLRPKVDAGHNNVRERASQERLRDHHDKRRRSYLQSLRNRLRILSRVRQSSSLAGRAVRPPGGMRVPAAARAAGSTILAGAVVATVVGVRIGTGRSFENMGANIQDYVFGGMSADAVAAAEAREFITSNPYLARSLRDNPDQVLGIYEGMRALAHDRAAGRQAAMADRRFQSNSEIDMIVLRVAQSVVRSVVEYAEQWDLGEVGKQLRLMYTVATIGGVFR
jgi:hypothetical protein